MKFKKIFFIFWILAFFSAQPLFCKEPLKKAEFSPSVAIVSDKEAQEKIKPPVLDNTDSGEDKTDKTIKPDSLDAPEPEEDILDKIVPDIDLPKAGKKLPEKTEQEPESLKENSDKIQNPEADDFISMDDILSKIEKRYSGSGFTASFIQKSVIKAMDIVDTADGILTVKHPSMMRWEYETPEKQIILTNGDVLWIFRPEDNQVMTGRAPSYFGDGKGASFLSNIRMIRDKFTVILEKDEDSLNYKLKMIPKEKKLDINLVIMLVSKKTFEVSQIATYNSYEDETLIEMSNFNFDENIDDAVFTFEIPEGADVVQLEE